MFSLTDSPKTTINYSGSGIYSSTDTTKNGMLDIASAPAALPEHFHMDVPFNLLFYTYHQDEQSQLILHQITPSQSLYTCFNPQETAYVTSFLRLHHHDYYELMFVIDGEVYQNIEHTRHLYPKGSCCLLNKNVCHTEEYSGDNRICFLQLSSEMILQLLTFPIFFDEENTECLKQLKAFFQVDLKEELTSAKEYMDFIPLEADEWIHEHIHAYLEKIVLEMYHPSAGASFRTSALLLELLCCLFHDQHYQHTPIRFGSEKERQLFDEITFYLRKSHGRISRRELSEKLSYSGDYLYKIVQKFTGLSLFSYGMHFCMKEAAELLSTTSMPVQEIAQKLGFSNFTHFYRIFKEEYHMTPREYRQAYHRILTSSDFPVASE